MAIYDPSKIFREEKGKIFIGGEEIKPDLRVALRDDARYFERSRLYEIIIQTARAEAIRMALPDSLNWDHVLSAKQLKYFSDIFEKLVITLKK